MYSFNILTAGHCVYSSKYGLSDQVIVYLPTSQFNWIQLKVSKYIYDSRSNGTSHNIALITLINPVPTNYKPICLTITEDVPSAIVIGFNHDKNTTKSLVQQSNVEYINLEKCENERLSWINKLPQLPVNQRLKFTGYNKIDSSMLCANDTINDKFDINHTNRLNLVKSNCKHNSGEPLISKSNDRWFLVGIVSGTWFNHDYNDCLTLLPTIYTGIWYYAEWINYNCIDCCLIETN
ncbi:serine protease 48-like [Panonychus citri]|uniref:serine protease 48-like n=1 Tax=Panonychus citri TaxID=50023 RepID=UPI0023079E97|nr:serine protease 48-like [Panonychus citri]